MNYILRAKVGAHDYYLRFEQNGDEINPDANELKGLKNNATVFYDQSVAAQALFRIKDRSIWPIDIIPHHP